MDERQRLLQMIARRAQAAVDAVAPASEAAAVLAAFEAADTPVAAFDLDQRLRFAEHASARRWPALACRLRRLSRCVQRLGD